MTYQTILYKETGSIADVILNRPEKRNALNDVMMKEIIAVFSEISTNKSMRVVVLSGAGSNFCSGMDLDYLQKISKYDLEQNKADSQNFKNMLLAIYGCSKPVIAKVSGYALAGGCGIATCCDMIIADETAKFGYPEVKIGFIPAIVMPFLLKRISETHAKDLMLTARVINADEALRMEMINAITTKDALDDKVNEFCTLFKNNSLYSISLTKELLRKISGVNYEYALEYASELNAETRMTEDFKQGIENFINKRKNK
ncbi:MAG: enoyl-CoA hydratase-related protein [Ignavibacteria bacterium]|jgi:methylglutaconyl-CoA hydratase